MFYKTVHTNYRSLIQLLHILSRLHTTHRNHRLPLLYRNQKHHPKILNSSSNTTQRNNTPILLNSVHRLKEIKNEITNRGGNPLEIDAAIKTGIAYTVIIAFISGILATRAAIIFAAGQLVATAFTQNPPWRAFISP
jgi:hypothetical protein